MNKVYVISSLIAAVVLIFMFVMLSAVASFIATHKGSSISKVCPHMTSPAMIGFCLTQ